jgi:TM2 domain-containing membrane protein YozV
MIWPSLYGRLGIQRERERRHLFKGVPKMPVGQRQWLAALLLSIFLGQLGIDRFYMGYTGKGLLKLITFGGLGIWWLYDVIVIAIGNLPDADGNTLAR